MQPAVRWRYLNRNPAVDAGRNPEPPREELRPFHPDQVDAAGAELDGSDQAAVILAAETGLRTSEWPALERRDVDRTGPVPVVHVQRRVVRGVVKPYPKTHRSRRQVPLTDAALAALDDLPPRLNTPLLFPAPEGGRLRLDNRRTRERYPALDAARVDRRGPYHLRHTFATEALAGGVSLYHLHRVMGTSLRETDRTYGHLARDSHASILAQLNTRSQRKGHEKATASDPGTDR